MKHWKRGVYLFVVLLCLYASLVASGIVVASDLQKLFASVTTAGPTNTAAETSLIGTVVGNTTIPANTFTTGMILETKAQGYVVAGNPTDSLTVQVKCGATSLATVQFDANGLTTPVAPGNVMAFRFWAMFTARSTGAGGSFSGNGLAELAGPVANSGPYTSNFLNTTPVSFDFTTACALNITAQWSGATVGETLQATDAAAWIIR